LLIQCENCGAPLDVTESTKLVTCAYCQVTQRIAKPATIHATPADWRAPQQWTPPPTARARSVALRFNPEAARRKGRQLSCVITTIILLATLLPIGLAALPSMAPAFHSWRWDGSETYVCAGNDQLKISGKTLKAKASPVIEAKGNCRLLIENSKISGKRLLLIGGNAHVTIEGSKLTALGSPGVTVEINGQLEVDDSTLAVDGQGSSLVTGVKTTMNAKAVFRDSKLTLEGGQSGGKIVVGHSGVSGGIRFEDSHVTISTTPKPAEIYLLDLGFNAEGASVGGSVDAGKMPLFTINRNEVEIRDANLHGSKVESKGGPVPGLR